MSHQEIIQQLSNNLPVFESLLKEVSPEQAKWKPSEKAWSLIEVTNHLFDEERDDFRTRLGLLLKDPNEEWPPIDPENWVTQKNYQGREFESSRDNFFDERKKSIQWLLSLENPNWKSTQHHPKFGSMVAEEMLANWLAHDFLHIRQITKLNWEFLNHKTEYGLNYAGDW